MIPKNITEGHSRKVCFVNDQSLRRYVNDGGKVWFSRTQKHFSVVHIAPRNCPFHITIFSNDVSNFE